MGFQLWRDVRKAVLSDNAFTYAQFSMLEMNPGFLLWCGSYRQVSALHPTLDMDHINSIWEYLCKVVSVAVVTVAWFDCTKSVKWNWRNLTAWSKQIMWCKFRYGRFILDASFLIESNDWENNYSLFKYMRRETK